MDVDCGYCFGKIKIDDYLECLECENYVHVRCLKRPGTPGDFVGDVFFQFKCFKCTPDGKEVFEREKIPWAIIISMAIYNLSVQSKGLSHRDYFHWRTHISHFIDKNWAYLMKPNEKRKKKWNGTVSGTLSHNSPALFTSGFSVFNEPGWWKLTHNKTPKQYFDLFKKIRREKPNEEVDIMTPTPETTLTLGKRPRAADSDDEECLVFSRTMPYMGRGPYQPNVKIKEEVDVLDFMETTDASEFIDDMPALSTESSIDVIPSTKTADWSNTFLELDFHDKGSDSDSEVAFEPRIVQVTNYQEVDPPPNSFLQNVKQEPPSEDEEIENEAYETKFSCKPSLFKVLPSVTRQPWESDDHKEDDFEDTEDFSGDKNIELISEYEENETHKRLKILLAPEYSKNVEVPDWVRRHYRKLCVRRTQRNLGRTIFDLDSFKRNPTVKKGQGTPAVLDRYHQLLTSNRSTKGENLSFHSRLAGFCQHELFISPHTGRVLHPFIYRNTKCLPTWVQLMCELQLKVNGTMPSRSSIDYCYVRPQYIAAVNALLQRTFWPGIDMSECLSYPDFSIVALYKKLVVGCAFLVPDVCHNEAYVSFMAVRPGWQRAGIASFMLYHLTQTCIGKDITLHVSATNPAICLYQKFGFKIEEKILDFYDKFMPIDSTDSRHAFFLRMER